MTYLRPLTLTMLFMLAMPAAVRSEMTLRGLTVIDVETGELAENQAIVIDDGIIRAVGPDDGRRPGDDPGDLNLDLAGKYAIPGLWDMHVHIRGGPEMAEDNRLWLRQYPGHGVTAVRDAGGDIPEFVLAWREAIANGEMAGPHIYTSLRKMDGSPVFRPGSVEIRKVAEIGPALRSMRAVGADFIKVNDGEYSKDLYLEVIRTAEALGLSTAAHIPIDVSIDELADAGLDSIEHDFYLVKFASAREQEIIDKYAAAEVEGDYFMHYMGMFNDFSRETDDAKARRSLRIMADRDIAITPTLYLSKRWHDIDDDADPKKDPGYFETPESILRSHDPKGTIEYMNERSETRVAEDLHTLAQAKRVVGMASEEGVTILAGSDTGRGNTFVYPGDSLHHELAELVDAGLTPQEALAAATVNAANWLGAGEHAGSIAPGKRADIVVLEANPLKDIGNTRSIVAVIQAGRVYDERALEELRRLPRSP